MCERVCVVMYIRARGSAMVAPVAGNSRTTSWSSSLVSSHRSQGNEYFSLVNVFMIVAWQRETKWRRRDALALYHRGIYLVILNDYLRIGDHGTLIVFHVFKFTSKLYFTYNH